MTRAQIQKIRKAIKSIKSANDTFYVEGENFSCRWNGFAFDWVVLGRLYKNCTRKEVLSWIGNGEHITNYCYDYGND